MEKCKRHGYGLADEKAPPDAVNADGISKADHLFDALPMPCADIPTLQEYLGYCLIPSTKGQKMILPFCDSSLSFHLTPAFRCLPTGRRGAF